MLASVLSWQRISDRGLIWRFWRRWHLGYGQHWRRILLVLVRHLANKRGARHWTWSFAWVVATAEIERAFEVNIVCFSVLSSSECNLLMHFLQAGERRGFWHWFRLYTWLQLIWRERSLIFGQLGKWHRRRWWLWWRRFRSIWSKIINRCHIARFGDIAKGGGGELGRA